MGSFIPSPGQGGGGGIPIVGGILSGLPLGGRIPQGFATWEEYFRYLLSQSRPDLFQDPGQPEEAQPPGESLPRGELPPAQPPVDRDPRTGEPVSRPSGIPDWAVPMIVGAGAAATLVWWDPFTDVGYEVGPQGDLTIKEDVFAEPEPVATEPQGPFGDLTFDPGGLTGAQTPPGPLDPVSQVPPSVTLPRPPVFTVDVFGDPFPPPPEAPMPVPPLRRGPDTQPPRGQQPPPVAGPPPATTPPPAETQPPPVNEPPPRQQPPPAGPPPPPGGGQPNPAAAAALAAGMGAPFAGPFAPVVGAGGPMQSLFPYPQLQQPWIPPLGFFIGGGF